MVQIPGIQEAYIEEVEGRRGKSMGISGVDKQLLLSII